MKHKLIKIDNYLLVVDDSEIKEGDWFLTDDKRVEQSAYDWNARKWHKKIIAHLPLNNSPILEGVPLLPPLEQEDDVEMKYYMELEQRREIAKNFKGQVAGRHPDMFGGNEMHHMVRGYMEAKQKYKYTEEDMIQAFAYGRTLEPFDSFEDFIQSLSQPKIPTHFEIEYTPKIPHKYTLEDHLDVEIKTTTNSQGQTEWVGKYIYEGGDQ